MPLDQQGFEIETDLELRIIDKVIDRLSHKENWLKFCWSRGEAMCVEGALCRAQVEVTGRAILEGPGRRVHDALDAACAPYDPMDFNNHPWTTHWGLMRMLRRARKLLVNKQ